MADNALYTAKTIAEISPLTQWITQVPVSIAEAKFLIKKFTKEDMSPNGDGYFVSEICNSYGSVKQRWLVVFLENVLLVLFNFRELCSPPPVLRWLSSM